MSSLQSSLWGIVSAGGEGVRLKGFVHEGSGTDVPEQFCAFVGRGTMPGRTVRRARLLIRCVAGSVPRMTCVMLQPLQEPSQSIQT